MLAESTGTFLLVFIGPGAGAVNAWSHGAITPVGVALAFAFGVTAIVAALGPISGAHINPAVTLGLWAGGRFPARAVLPYVTAQLVGGILAALLLNLLLPSAIEGALTLPVIGQAQTAIVEVVLTFFLMLVVMAVVSGNVAGGLAAPAIGLVVGADALMGGPLTGASMNPARTLGPALAAGRWDSHWAYWIGPTVGAIVAARCYEYLREESSNAQ
jgi:aquaporin Z